MKSQNRLPAGAAVLVTGANGFIASHIVERLLASGYRVRGTVRDAADEARVAHLLAFEGARERLELVEADLTAADPFSRHLDVDAVIHTASPYAVSVGDPQRDLVEPAVRGTVALMEAAASAPRVRRVVLTSSVAAVTDEPDGRVLTESDWNLTSSLRRNPYHYSKTLAERAAWDVMDRRDPDFELTVINPFLVIGPQHAGPTNESNRILADLVNGRYPVVMALEWGIVDVRDVACAHVAALEGEGSRGRHLVVAGTLSMADIVEEARAAGWGRARLPRIDMTGRIGTAVMRLAARFQPAGVSDYLASHLGRHVRYDNSKAISAFGLAYRDPRTALRDALADLARRKVIPAPETAAA